MVLCQVLAGLGGVGKTQLAAALAHRLWVDREVDLLVWIAASSQTAILTSYVDAAARITGVDDADPGHAVRRFLAWLAEPHQLRWLIVLDNLDDPNDMIGLWPPSTSRGRTVVTTRRRDHALTTGRHLIDVDVFTPDQAIAYLHQKLAGRPQRLDEAEDLASELGYLPLALSQAVAYLLDRGPGMTCARYRRLLTDQHRRLADLAPHALPDQHRDIVAATWALSIGRANDLAPIGLARPLLEMAALLDPNGIPLDVFTANAVADYCGGRLGHPVAPGDLDDALHILHRFSLVTIDEVTDMAHVHGLLQRAVRDVTGADRQPALAITAASALLELWHADKRDAGHTQVLRANTAALRATAGHHLCTSNSGAHPLLFRAITSLGQVGLVTTAVADYQQLITDLLRILGPDHPDTLTARSDLAHWLGEVGDPAGAVSALQRVLNDRLRILGLDHPDTLMTRHNLAFWVARAGDPAGAASALHQVLNDRLRILGPDHPHTLMTRHYLARWHGEAGDPAGAVSALKQVLNDRLRILGPDHPHTLMTRHNLARWQGELGDPAGAASAFQQILNDRLRILGPDDPATLATRRNLADWRGEAGDLAGAAYALQKLLDDSLRVLGPDHYITLFTRDSLASWRGEGGDSAGAASAYQKLLDDRLRILGPDHRDTRTTRSSLAYWREQVDANNDTQ